jgi:lycopene cyclase domain-containing protein
MSYPVVALLFLAASASLAVALTLVARPDRRWWACTAAVAAVLMVLTAVFDSLMISADLFRFDESKLLGVHILLAPLEDFAWPLAAALVLPSLWTALDRSGGRPR